MTNLSGWEKVRDDEDKKMKMLLHEAQYLLYFTECLCFGILNLPYMQVCVYVFRSVFASMHALWSMWAETEKQPCVHTPAHLCLVSVPVSGRRWSAALIDKTIKTSPPLPSCWLCVSLVSPPEKVSMLSALIAPFKYISPGTSSTEDEDSLSKPLPLFFSLHQHAALTPSVAGLIWKWSLCHPHN